MATQEGIPPAATALGLIGTLLWCVQLLPQIWTNWKTKNTVGLRGGMVFCWAVCGPPFGVCAIVQNFNVPLKLQPNIFTALALVVWGQVMFYGGRMTAFKAFLSSLALATTFSAFETLLVLKLRDPYERGISYPITILGIIASVLLGAGLIFPYLELRKPFRHGHVLGINFIFLGADFTGAFFSLMALVVQARFSLLGGIFYIVCMVLEGGLFVSQLLWIRRYRNERKEARELGLSFEDLMRSRFDRESPASLKPGTEEKYREAQRTTDNVA